MIYTNVYIPDRHSPLERMREEIEMLKFKLQRSEERANKLQDILDNIPEAVEKHGYVDISYGRDNKIKLIKST